MNKTKIIFKTKQGPQGIQGEKGDTGVPGEKVRT